MLTRRQLLIAGLAAGAATQLPRMARAAPLRLRAMSFDGTILPGNLTRDMMGYADGPPPTLRLTQGQPAENALDEVTTVHWHGQRVPMDQDVVPYLTQFPIGVGESYSYRFTPQDADTYWYHPHCNTFQQISRGMAGLLVVDEPEDPGFDADIPQLIRDFRLDDNGAFLPFSTPRNAARGGTLGTVHTANWQVDEATPAHAGGLLRLRLAAADVTRIYALSVTGAAAAMVIALDGHPLPTPLPGGEMRLAPGQRADLALVMPDAGEVLPQMTLGGSKTHPLHRLIAEGPPLRRSLANLAPLSPNPIAEPDLAKAKVIDFTLGWTPEGGPGVDGPCGDTPYAFWSINRQVWPGDSRDPGAPIATLTLGQSYIFRLRNENQNAHPVHLHGHAFRVVGGTGGFTDTVLLDAHATAEIAFVADNPGDWVLHCHVIEHQKTGLTAYIRVA